MTMIVFDNIVDYLLAFIAAILGITVPVMLQVIERVDQRYESTRLSKRLQSEKCIKACYISLIVAVISCTYNLFVKIPSPCDCWVLNNSSNLIALISCAFLIATFLRSCCRILTYYNPETLQNRILKEYEQTKDSLKKESCFLDWVDLTKTLLQSSDKGPARKIYNVFADEINKVFDSADKNGASFPPFLSRSILSINENLCLMQRRPYSVNNGNQLLKNLICQPSKLNEEIYRLLWDNLQLQLFYGREDWVYEYWSAAVQVYDLNLRELHEGTPYDIVSEHLATKKDVEDRETARQRFLEFHIMLCADILRKERYSLLENVLSYVRSMSPEYDYPLVPSSLEEIINAFINIEYSPRLDFGAENYYPIRDEKGIVDGIIQGSCKRYLAFLYVRMFANIGRMLNPHLIYSEKLGDLKRIEEAINFILQSLPQIFENDKLMKILSFTDFEAAESRMTEMLQKAKAELKSKQDEVREKGRFSEELVEDNLESVKVITDRNLKAYKVFEATSSDGERSTYYLRGLASYLYPNEAFQKDAGMSYSNMSEATTESALVRFQHDFASVFFMKSRKQFKINSADMLAAIDQLDLKDGFVIISFDICWLSYLCDNNFLIKDNNGQYSYKGIRIISLSAGPSEALSQTLFVMKLNDIPLVQYIKPLPEQISKYELKELDNKYELYGSIVKLSEKDELLGNVDKLSCDEAKRHALFSVFINAKLFWKDSAQLVSIRLMRNFRDNGMPDTFDSIPHFEDNFICQN